MTLHKMPSDSRSGPDHRFSDLLGLEAWMGLPAAVRARFCRRLEHGVSVAYRGRVTGMRMTLAGRVLAWAARLIGAPLPYDSASVGRAAVVIVTEDAATGGQVWIRQYSRASGFPQVVRSSKRFAGPTGLEEYVGYGIGMALTMRATRHALHFRSDHYFVQILGRRIRLPRILTPGTLTIGHHNLGNRQFIFSLSLRSRLFGEMIRQDAIFND